MFPVHTRPTFEKAVYFGNSMLCIGKTPCHSLIDKGTGHCENSMKKTIFEELYTILIFQVFPAHKLTDTNYRIINYASRIPPARLPSLYHDWKYKF